MTWSAGSLNPERAEASWERSEVIAEANGPRWKRKDWPIQANGELVSALDYWQETVANLRGPTGYR